MCKPGLPVRIVTQLRWFGVAVQWGGACGGSEQFLASDISGRVCLYGNGMTLSIWRRHAGVMKTCFAADCESDGRQYCKHWESRRQFLQFSLSPLRCAARLTRMQTRPCGAATAGPRCCCCGRRHRLQWHRPVCQGYQVQPATSLTC